jgi:hypothetical protein
MPNAWAKLTSKLDQADEHIFNLKIAWDGFVESGAYPIESEDDPDTGERIYRIVNVAPIDPSFPLIIGDAINNIRSALDHLAYHLVQLGPAPIEKVYFPIGKRSKEFETDSGGIKQRLRSDAIKPLSEIKAYQEGSDELLWQLDCINNIDKHRLLLTVSAQNRFHSMRPSEAREAYADFLGVEGIESAISGGNIHTLRWNPILDLKPRDILARVPKHEVQEKMQFPIEIAFGESRILKGYPVIVTLNRMFDRVRYIINKFGSVGLLE